MSEKILTPIKAIRAKCLDCATTSNEVRLCPIPDCPLFAFRLGKNPNRKSNMTDEQKQQARERMKRRFEQKTINANALRNF